MDTFLAKGLIVLCWTIGASTSIQADPESLGLWAQWGLAGIVVAYVLWRDTAREKQMWEKAHRDQQFLQDTLIHIVKDNTEALNRMRSAVEQCKVSTIQGPAIQVQDTDKGNSK